MRKSSFKEYFSFCALRQLDCSYTYFFRRQFSSTQKGRETLVSSAMINTCTVHSHRKAIIGMLFSQYNYPVFTSMHRLATCKYKPTKCMILGSMMNFGGNTCNN